MFLNLHWKHQRPGLFERPSEQFVGSAGLGNAAWVVVGKNDSGRVMPKGSVLRWCCSCCLPCPYRWYREFGAHSQQTSFDAFGFWNEKSDTKPAIVVDE